MYQVYSLQCPGRPRWALVACALLLLLTVGMAAALIQRRTRAREIALGRSAAYPAGGLRACLPLGWTPIEADELPVGGVAGVERPPAGGPASRLFLFRGIPRVLGLPSSECLSAVVQIAQSLSGGVPVGAQPRGPARVGSLPGWTVATGTSVGAALLGAKWRYCLGRAAIGPGGEIVGLILHLPRPPRRDDEYLLDEVSQRMDLISASLADDPRALMMAAGITFEPPPEARFVANANKSLPRIRMMGGQGLTCWFLDVHRVPLIGERSPAALVEDHVLAVLQDARLPGPIETTEIGKRQVARIHFSVPLSPDPSVYVLAARTDDHTGLLLVGRHEVDAAPILLNLCRSIVASASVAPYGELIDITRAQETARKWLSQIADEGLARAWGPLDGGELVYTIRSPAIALGREVRTYRKRPEHGTDWWSIVSKWEFAFPQGVSRDSAEKWLIRDDGAKHAGSFQRNVGGQPETTYAEQRLDRIEQVDRELHVVSGGEVISRDGGVSVDDTFACEPVLIRAGAHVARDPQRSPAVFSITETYTRTTSYWLLVPIGPAELPGPRSGESAPAVLLQRDYDPSPIILYYDQADRPLAVRFGNGQWSELAQRAAEQVPGVSSARAGP